MGPQNINFARVSRIAVNMLLIKANFGRFKNKVVKISYCLEIQCQIRKKCTLGKLLKWAPWSQQKNNEKLIHMYYLLTSFMFLLWPTLLLVFHGLHYYFSAVLRATSMSVYTVSLHMCGVSTFVFKFLKFIYRYAKWSRTWNMFLFPVAWQEFKSPSYECFCFFSRVFFLSFFLSSLHPMQLSAPTPSTQSAHGVNPALLRFPLKNYKDIPQYWTRSTLT